VWTGASTSPQRSSYRCVEAADRRPDRSRRHPLAAHRRGAHGRFGGGGARGGDGRPSARRAIRRTRKFGLAFCFATQEIGTLARSIYNNLGTYVFAYGLKTSSEAERVREVLSDESAFKLYPEFRS
jgi:hypothetical protein